MADPRFRLTALLLALILTGCSGSTPPSPPVASTPSPSAKTITQIVPSSSATCNLTLTQESGSSQAVPEKMLYIARGSRLDAVDRDTGKSCWQVSEKEGKPLQCSREAERGRVFCRVGLGGPTYALNAGTGEFLYTLEAELPGDMVAATDTSLLVFCDGEILYALDAATGKEMWSSRPGGMLRIGGIVENVLYFGSNNDYYAALDLDTHQEKWRVEFRNNGRPGMSLVSDQRIYLETATQAGKSTITALDAENGREKWRFICQKDLSGLTIAEGKVLFGTYDGRLYALESSTGKLAWHASLDGAIENPPATAGGIAFVGTRKDRLYAFDIKTGKALWSFPGKSGFRIFSSPVPSAGKVLYLHTSDSKNITELRVVDAKTGKLLWKMEVQVLAFDHYILLENDLLYITDVKNRVCAVDLTTGNVKWRLP